MPDEETRLFACIDAACSTETGQEAEERRNEARSTLRDFLWKARIDFDVMASVNPKPDRLAEAARRWALLYRLVHSRRWEPEEETRRQAILEKIADEAGLPSLHFQLCWFMQDIGHAILASPDPVKKCACILRRPSRRGRKERPFAQRVEIAAEVEKLRPVKKLRPDGSFEKRPGMTRENACKKVAETTRPLIGIDAVRRIYENATKEKGGAALVRLVAADLVEF